jgi:hypothetical protein
LNYMRICFNDCFEIKWNSHIMIISMDDVK